MDTIGAQFATERKKRGLEFVDVEHAIGIRALYIQALEEGHYDVLPGEVYVKGFIRNYGNFLGMDGAALVQTYSASKASTEPHLSAEKLVQSSSAAGKKTLGIVVAAVLILTAAGGGLYFWQKGRSESSSRSTPVSQVQPALPPTPAKPAPSPALPPASVPAAIPSISAKAVSVTAHFTDRCWTSAIADGKTVYEGIPKSGETLIWEAERQIVLNLGNAGAVDITLNGQPQGKMGGRGDVVVKTFNAPQSSTQSITPSPSIPPASNSQSAPGQPTIRP